MALPSLYRVRLRFDEEVRRDGTIDVHMPDDGRTYDWGSFFTLPEAHDAREKLLKKHPFEAQLLSAEVIVSLDGGWTWQRADDD